MGILFFSVLLIAFTKIQASTICNTSAIGACKSPEAAIRCIASDDQPLLEKLHALKEKRLLVFSPNEKCLKALRTGGVNIEDNIITYRNIKHPNCYSYLHKCIFDPAKKTLTPLNYKNNSLPFNGSLCTWMSSPQLSDIPFNQLVLPGAHDALTSTITAKSQFAPDAPAFMKKLHGPLKTIIANWARAQAYSVRDLLNLGVRYLDVRVANNNGEFWSIHSLYGENFENSLLQVSEFLHRNPQEIIVIDIQNLEASEQNRHSDCMNLDKLISDTLFSYDETSEGFELVNSVRVTDPSIIKSKTATKDDITRKLKDIQNSKVRVFIFVRREQFPNLNFDNNGVAIGAYGINYIDRNYVESKWHNVAEKISMETKIFTQLAERDLDLQRHEKLLVLQVQPTPATEEIVKGLLPIGVRSLEDLANKWNKDPEFIKSCEHFVHQSQGGIVMLDFMDEATNRTIIGFNKHTEGIDPPIP